MEDPRKTPVPPARVGRLNVFVERVSLGDIEIDIYAAADEGAPASARYLLYNRGACLKLTEPFW